MRSGFQEHIPGGTLPKDKEIREYLATARGLRESQVRPFFSSFPLPTLWKLADVVGVPFEQKFTDVAHAAVLNALTTEIIRQLEGQ